MIPHFTAKRGGIRYPKPGDPPLPPRIPIPLPEVYGKLKEAYAPNDVLLAVVRHHVPEDPGYGTERRCYGCDVSTYGEPPAWPCSTSRLLIHLAGLD